MASVWSSPQLVFPDFLRQAAALPAATIPDLWERAFAGELAVILSLGLLAGSVCGGAAVMSVFGESMSPCIAGLPVEGIRLAIRGVLPPKVANGCFVADFRAALRFDTAVDEPLAKGLKQ